MNNGFTVFAIIIASPGLVNAHDAHTAMHENGEDCNGGGWNGGDWNGGT